MKKFGKQLLVGVGLLFGLCAPALAQSRLQQMLQPKAASEDVAPRGAAVPGQPNLYASTVLKACNSVQSCSMLLDAVPAGRTLAATNLNCIASPDGPSFPEQQALFSLSQNDLTKAFFVVTGSVAFSTNEQIRAYFPQNARPKVVGALLTAGKMSLLSCTLSGTLLK